MEPLKFIIFSTSQSFFKTILNSFEKWKKQIWNDGLVQKEAIRLALIGNSQSLKWDSDQQKSYFKEFRQVQGVDC